MIFIPGIVTFLHDLFTAVWIGGLFFLVVIMFPLLKKEQSKGNNLSNFSLQLQKRLRIFVLISIVGLWITGMILAKQNQAGGLLKFGTTYQILLSIKHLFIIGMIAIIGWRYVQLNKLEKVLKSENSNPQEAKKLMKMSVLPVFLNSLLGCGVLLLTGLLAVN